MSTQPTIKRVDMLNIKVMASVGYDASVTARLVGVEGSAVLAVIFGQPGIDYSVVEVRS